MIRIGRAGVRNSLTANNSGMSKRADDRLDAVVDAHAAKFKTALAVDGSVAFIFNKHKGITACTCRGFQNLNGAARHEVRSAGHETPRGEVNLQSNGVRTADVPQSMIQGVRQVSGLIRRDNLDQYLELKNQSDPIKQKIEGKQSEDDGFTDDPSQDVLDALTDNQSMVYSGDGDPLKDILNADNDGNSSTHLFSSGMVACPICFGAGFVDTWRLYNGERILLDASNRYNIEIYNDVDIDETAQPAVYSIRERSWLEWTNVDFPLSWNHLLRLAVFNRGKLVSPDSYNLYFEHRAQPGVRNRLTYEALRALNNGPLLRNSNKLKIIIESNLGMNEALVFTHVEIMLHLGEATRIQVPEMDVPNEDEFVDWNLNATFELPSDIDIRENSYIVEGKYRRVWKVSTVNRKVTARGKSFGYSVGARAIHSFERQFVLMNVLGKPIDPFSTSILKTSYEDD